MQAAAPDPGGERSPGGVGPPQSRDGAGGGGGWAVVLRGTDAGEADRSGTSAPLLNLAGQCEPNWGSEG